VAARLSRQPQALASARMVRKYLDAAAALNEARADVGRWAGQVAVIGLEEPAELLKGTARELEAGAEALASGVHGDDGGDSPTR
jgi:hypothetical protein